MVLDDFLRALVVACPALLLAARFAWPRKIPWWAVVAITAAASWALHTLRWHLGWVAIQEANDACSRAPMNSECSYIASYHPGIPPTEGRWLPGVEWLLLLSLLYCGAWWAKERRLRISKELLPNTSLERTREG